MQDQATIDKIAKLLRLTKSNHSGEAATALLKAKQIALRYGINLSEFDIDGQIKESSPFVDHRIPLGVFVSVEDTLAIEIISAYFNVKVYQYGSPGKETGLGIIGLPTHVQIAIETFMYLRTAARKCWNDRRKEWMEGFFTGVFQNLKEEMDADVEITAANNSRAIVLLKQNIEVYYRAKYESTPATGYQGDKARPWSDTHAEGHLDGSKIKVSPNRVDEGRMIAASQ